MHDPLTVVWTARIPFTGKRNAVGAWEKYPETLFVVWHRDPETDGTDDSCDWVGWKLPEELRERVKEEGRNEWKYYFDPELGAPLRFSSDLEIVFAVWRAVDWRFGKRRKVLPARDIFEIFSLTANATDNIIRTVTEARTSPDGMAILFYTVFRNYRRHSRPWWKSPRFHFWHYRIQIPAVQYLKRSLFSRCYGCGKGFRYGESVTSTQWDSTGPLWFKSERYIYHNKCVPAPSQVAKTQEVP